MLIRFANIPVIVDVNGRIEPSVAAWALWLTESQERSAGTVHSYVNALSLFFDYLSFYDVFDSTEKDIEWMLTRFKIALRDGLPDIGWPDHSDSYVSNVLTAVSLYLEYIDLRDVSSVYRGVNRFVRTARKARSFLGHIKPGTISRTKRNQRQRNVRIGIKSGPRAVRYFPPEKFWEFIDAVPSHRDKALYLLMAGTSARISQALNVWQRDVLFDKRKVIFKDPREHDRRKDLKIHYGLCPDERIQNKGPLPGVWVLPSLKKEFFRQAILYREREFIPEGKHVHPHPYFFITKTSGRLSIRQVDHQFQIITDRLGIKGLSPHSLRHLYGYYAFVILGVDIAYLQYCMGHRHVSSTEMYTHIPTDISETILRRALKKLEEIKDSSKGATHRIRFETGPVYQNLITNGRD